LTFGVLAAAAAATPASDNVTPGVLGFLVVAAMGVALVFLLKSMNKQFRKITPGAGKREEPTGAKGAEGPKGPRGPRGPKPAQAGTSPREEPK
jgi:hypothetical protein